MKHAPLTRAALLVYGILVLVVLYVPVAAIAFASFSKARYLSFPIRRYTTEWYERAFDSSTVPELVSTSLKVAFAVAVISVVIGFFGALAFARYR